MNAEPELVPAAADNQNMTIHVSCRVCYPDIYVGMKAICGAGLLGVIPDAESTYRRCAECDDLRFHPPCCRRG